MSSWLEWGDCPKCGQLVASEYDTKTGEVYYWHTETGEKDCTIDELKINLRDYAFHIMEGGEI